jgi:hypothetical protein
MTKKYTLELTEAEVRGMNLIMNSGYESMTQDALEMMENVGDRKDELRTIIEMMLCVDAAAFKYALATGSELTEGQELVIKMANEVDLEKMIEKIKVFAGADNEAE